MARLALSFILILSLFSGAASSTEHLSTPQLIDKGLKARASDFTLLNHVVTELDSRSLTSVQNDYLKYLRGYLLGAQGSFSETIEILEDVLKTTTSFEVRALSASSLVNAYAGQGDWSKGLSATYELTQLTADLKETSELFQNALAVKAVFFNQIEQHKLGLEQAQQLFKVTSNPRLKCASINLIIESSNQLNRAIEDQSFLEPAIGSCASFPMIGAFTSIYVAEYYLNQGDFHKVEDILAPKIAAFDNLQYSPLILDSNYILAQAYLGLGQEQRATDLLKKLIDLNASNVNKARLANVYLLLVDARKPQGEAAIALELMQKHLQLREEYLNDVTSKRLAFQLVQQKILEKDNEINLLNSKNQLLEAQEELLAAKAENNRLFVLLLSLVLILLCLYIYRARKGQKRLRQLAQYDALTGVHNRGHFTELAKSALQLAKDSKQPASIVLFDLDLFKKINDSFGHGCGDWVLKQVAQTCQEIARQNDVFARVGGEEFCFLLLGCDSHTALDVAEKCRRAIYAIDTKPSGFDFKVSGSFGVSDNNLSGYELDRILADADEALYCAKSDGRNTVCLFDPSAEQTALLKPDGSLTS